MRHANPMDLVHEDIAAIKRDLAAVVDGRLSSLGDRTKEVVSQAKDGAIAKHRQLGKFAGTRPITTIVFATAAGAAAATLVGWLGRRSE